jgi:hypothetical protein
MVKMVSCGDAQLRAANVKTDDRRVSCAAAPYRHQLWRVLLKLGRSLLDSLGLSGTSTFRGASKVPQKRA